jgi:hypothetical protein
MKKILFAVSGMLCCIIILVAIYLLLTKHGTSSQLEQKIFSVVQLQQTIHTTPTSRPIPENCKDFPLANGCGVVGYSINVCSNQYTNYPPISDILTTNNDPVIGIYKGKITDLNVHLHTITVTSDKSTKPFVFTGASVNGKMFDIHNTPITDFYSLKPGPKAVVSFNCDQKNGYFILNRFQMVQ